MRPALTLKPMYTLRLGENAAVLDHDTDLIEFTAASRSYDR